MNDVLGVESGVDTGVEMAVDRGIDMSIGIMGVKNPALGLRRPPLRNGSGERLTIKLSKNLKRSCSLPARGRT